MSDSNYPHGKTLIKYLKRPMNGFQAELNVKLPHVYIEEDGAIVEVSSELAWSLVMNGRAVMVSPNAQAIVPKAESPTPISSDPDDSDEEEDDSYEEELDDSYEEEGDDEEEELDDSYEEEGE